jgi:hypothetical protein
MLGKAARQQGSKAARQQGSKGAGLKATTFLFVQGN